MIDLVEYFLNDPAAAQPDAKIRLKEWRREEGAGRENHESGKNRDF